MSTSSQRILGFSLTVAGMALVGVLSYKAWGYRSAAIAAQQQILALSVQPRENREFLDKIVRRDAGLHLTGALDKRAALLAIRDYVYRSFDNEPEELASVTPDIVYAALGSDENNMYCGGAALAYTWALNAIGIPARFIQLGGQDFLAGKDLYQTHATVEAMIDGKWEISDPTFNVSVRCTDNDIENLSVHGVRTCLALGGTLKYLPGRTQFKDRLVEPDKYPAYFAAFTRRAVSSSDVKETEESYPSNGWIEKAMKAYH